MTKRRSDRARTMGQEILDRSVEADDPPPETPLTGASKATSPPPEEALPPAARASRDDAEDPPSRSD
jgi:hypothetical protein